MQSKCARTGVVSVLGRSRLTTVSRRLYIGTVSSVGDDGGLRILETNRSESTSPYPPNQRLASSRCVYRPKCALIDPKIGCTKEMYCPCTGLLPGALG